MAIVILIIYFWYDPGAGGEKHIRLEIGKGGFFSVFPKDSNGFTFTWRYVGAGKYMTSIETHKKKD